MSRLDLPQIANLNGNSHAHHHCSPVRSSKVSGFQHVSTWSLQSRWVIDFMCRSQMCIGYPARPATNRDSGSSGIAPLVVLSRARDRPQQLDKCLAELTRDCCWQVVMIALEALSVLLSNVETSDARSLRAVTRILSPGRDRDWVP